MSLFNAGAGNDHLNFICNFKDPLNIQVAIDTDENGSFWESISSELSNLNREFNDSKEKVDIKFNVGCRVITILTKKVSTPKEGVEEIILEALKAISSTREEKKFTKLLRLAEKARDRDKIEICNTILNEIEKEIERLESDRERLELDEEYRMFLAEVKREYEKIEQSVKPSESQGYGKKRFSTEKLLEELGIEIENDDYDCHLNKRRRTEVVDDDGNDKEFEGERTLHGAAFKNQASNIVNIYTVFPEDIDERDERGMTPLLVACANHSFDAANVLLDLGADPLSKDNCECSALIHLMKAQGVLNEEESSKQYDLFKKLISSNNQIFAYDNERKSALHWAILTGKEKYAMELIDLLDKDSQKLFLEEIFYFCYQYNSDKVFSDLLYKRKGLKKNCKELFIAACDNKDVEAIYFFVKANVDIRELIGKIYAKENPEHIEQICKNVINGFRDNTGRTSLMIACDHNDFDTAFALLALGAEHHLEDHYGCSALILLMKNQKQLNEEESKKQFQLFDTFTLFNDQVFSLDLEGKSAFDWAMITGKENYVFNIIDLIENDQVDLLEKILISACHYDSAKVVEYLLSSGKCSNMNFERISEILLKFAYSKKNPIIIYFLLNARVDIKSKFYTFFKGKQEKTINKYFNEMISRYRDDSGLTPLMIACDRNNFKVAKKLIKYGANIEIADDNGNTALFHFLKNPVQVPLYDKNFRRDKLFYKLISNLFWADNQGINALDWAIISGKERYAWKIAKLIDENSPPGVLENAFESACQHNSKYIIKELLNNRYLLDPFKRNGLWFLRTALKYKHIDVINQLANTSIDIKTLFYDICEKQDFESLKFLIENDVHPPDLHIENFPLIHWILITCCKLDDPILFDIALKMVYKIDINTRGVARCAVLHAAVMAKHVEFVKILLDLGADINDRDNDFSASPLDLALDPQLPPDPQKDEIVKILLNKQSEMNQSF